MNKESADCTDGRRESVPENCLVIRPGALGDTILALPLLRSIQREHPSSTVTFLGNRAYRDLLPPGIQFQAMDDLKWLWLFSGTEDELPGTVAHFDDVYVVLEKPQQVMDNLRRAGTSRIRQVGSRPRQGIHVVEHLHKGLGLAVPDPSPALAHLASTEKKDMVWIHPGSGGRGKRLPVEHAANLVQGLRHELGWEVAISAGREDGFLKESSHWPRMMAVAGCRLWENLPLKDLCRELGTARLFVGTDSGIAHLAAGLGIRSVVLYVASDPDGWRPWVPESELCVVRARGGETGWGGMCGAVLDALSSARLI